MDWNCTLTEERLSDVLDRALPPDASAAFSAHAGECERCTKLLGQIGGILLQVQQLRSIEEPPFLASRIIAATRGTPARAGKGWLAWSPAIWQTRFAMGIVTVAATFLIVLHAVNAGMPGKLQLSPTSLYHEVNRRAHLTYARGAKFVNDLRVVYEIQSRLSLQPQQPEPALEPTPAPAPEPREGRPDSYARPKPQTTPPSTHRAFTNGTELALLMFAIETGNASEEMPRSLP
jgi:anti-sigma factor RsiW